MASRRSRSRSSAMMCGLPPRTRSPAPEARGFSPRAGAAMPIRRCISVGFMSPLRPPRGPAAVKIGAAVLMLVLLASPARAQTAQAFEQCGGEEVATPDARIAACTALIASGELNPTNLAAAYDNRGVAYAAQSRFDLALADYAQATTLNPDDATAFDNQGLAFVSGGQYASAIASYDRGNANAGKQQYDAAIADYDAALKRNPGSAATFNNRGLAYAAKGQYDRAMADYDQAIKLDANSAFAFNNRGLAETAQGHDQRAIADYDQAIKLDPNYAAAFYNRGLAKQHSGDAKGGKEDVAKARQLDPGIRQMANAPGDATPR